MRPGKVHQGSADAGELRATSKTSLTTFEVLRREFNYPGEMLSHLLPRLPTPFPLPDLEEDVVEEIEKLVEVVSP